MNRSIASQLVSIASLAAMPAALAQSYSFTLLDSAIPGSTASAVPYSISGNGLVIAGGDTRYSSGEQPFIWQKIGGQWIRSQLPVPPAGTDGLQSRGRGTSLSFDGDVIAGMAGNSNSAAVPTYGYPAIWTSVLSGQVEMQLVADDSTLRGSSNGVSEDGTKMVWTQVLADGLDSRRVFLWNQGVSTQIAPSLGSNVIQASASSFFAPQLISGDGTVVGFNADVAIDESYAFVSEQGTIRQLQVRPEIPILQIAGPNRYVRAISRDGTTIIGEGAESYFSNARTRAIVWNQQGQLSVLRLIVPRPAPDASYTTATDLSADGQVIVGSQFEILPFFQRRDQLQNARAVVWVNRHPRTLQSILTQQGVSLGTVIPVIVTGVSDDGGTLTGVGLASAAINSPLVSFVATILPPGVCDDIDFNRDGNRFDPLDIDAFLSVFSEGPCLPVGASCRDIDFNNDGSLFDPEDVDAFFRVFSEGPCTL